MSTAETPAEVCEAVARWNWWEEHRAECPAHRIPEAAELAEVLPERPEDATAEGADATAAAVEIANDAWQILTAHGMPRQNGAMRFDVYGFKLPSGVVIEAAGHLKRTEIKAGDPDLLVIAMHLLWKTGAQHDPDLRHPLTPLVGWWQAFAPVPVAPEKRADRRIMPALKVTGPSMERQRGARMVAFGGLLDGRADHAELTLWPEPARHRVPLLEIVERTGLPFRSRGRGAPLEPRLLVRGGLLMIRPEDRGRETVRVAVTVRELIGALWPPGADGRRHERQHWPQLLDALYRARDWTVTDAGGGRWFPMALRRLPRVAPRHGSMPALDDLIVLDLAPPPGAVAGPSVDLPWLDRQGVVSGPAWFAYIAARSLIWMPGKTRRPAPGGRWGWSRNPDDYPVLTLADLRRLAFGAADAKHRSHAEIVAPWENLPDVRLLPDATAPSTGVRGFRLLPGEGGPGPPAAAP